MITFILYYDYEALHYIFKQFIKHQNDGFSKLNRCYNV